jgi:hypothetical protein
MGFVMHALTPKFGHRFLRARSRQHTKEEKTNGGKL